ncbi:Putative Phage-related protein [Candidatus Glomeribacter gigasporarum BEG34]|uniref:Putative Phage-related protein n=1 Tax=Candidatus Glomeribacter gigasporarum BEG34 TaxID=1070319 RepID=G2J7X5_9BURK|nr:coiled-coil domain-containing protein [Candidatus Glomeribacter gigasporarum]CCD28870.1 Putative Phage-related protein [Candidatus Glomeribacter gigasporarum BEG34]
MTLAAFDTHKFVRTLKGAGFNEKQAEALTDAVRESQAFSEVATKSDLRELELRIEAKFANVDGELKFLKWILGFIAAGVASLVLKAFF